MNVPNTFPVFVRNADQAVNADPSKLDASKVATYASKAALFDESTWLWWTMTRASREPGQTGRGSGMS